MGLADRDMESAVRSDTADPHIVEAADLGRRHECTFRHDGARLRLVESPVVAPIEAQDPVER